jgi:hypothetical protein
MAIVFGLPWALLMWSCVVPRPQGFLPHIYGISRTSAVGRMVIFFIALLLLCFTISNTLTRIFTSVMAVMMVPPVVGCILVSRRSSDDGELWHDSLVVLKRSRDRLIAPLKHFALGALRLLYPRPTPHIPDEVGSAHSMTERQDGVAVSGFMNPPQV